MALSLKKKSNNKKVKKKKKHKTAQFTSINFKKKQKQITYIIEEKKIIQ